MIEFSVLDRLAGNFDDGSDRERRGVSGQTNTIVTRAEFGKYRDAVRRDLEWLLNTRQIADPVPDGLKEIERSVYCYGLPDFTQLNLHPGRSATDQLRLAATITRTIQLFEPRIIDVRVTVAVRAASNQNVYFQVSGKLKLKPRPEPVFYDTKLDVSMGAYAVEVAGEGRA
jgi:type VI secretion system protein ImpF